MPLLRIICPPADTGRIVSALEDRVGAASVTVVPVSYPAGGDLIMADLGRDRVDLLLSLVRRASPKADLHVALAPSRQLLPPPPPGAADRVIWAQVTDDIATAGRLCWTNILLVVAAAAIAAIGIVHDQLLLIVGAMALSPDYYPIAHTFLALSRRAWAAAVRGGLTLLAGYGAAIGGAAVLVWTLGLAGWVSTRAEVDHPLTLFISEPDPLSVVVAAIAGVAGALAITLSGTRGLVGVFVSVMTIPAAANIGVALAARDPGELAGAAVQLASNVAALLVAGTITVAFLHRGRAPRPLHLPPKQEQSNPEVGTGLSSALDEQGGGQETNAQ